MHIEKNLCENMVKTTLGKKDSYGSRQDMQRHGIRQDLWLRPSRNRKEIFHMPRAPYIFSIQDKVAVVDIIKRLKTPSNYVGAI
jgi:hypothetical protein